MGYYGLAELKGSVARMKHHKHTENREPMGHLKGREEGVGGGLSTVRLYLGGLYLSQDRISEPKLGYDDYNDEQIMAGNTK